LTLAAHIVVRSIRSNFEILRDMANYDQLTGCLNRHAAHSILQHEVVRYTENNLPLTVLMADLDHFKAINDTFGHNAGDMVLKKFSRVVGSALRRCDLLCRWGERSFSWYCEALCRTKHSRLQTGYAAGLKVLFFSHMTDAES